MQKLSISKSNSLRYFDFFFGTDLSNTCHLHMVFPRRDKAFGGILVYIYLYRIKKDQEIYSERFIPLLVLVKYFMQHVRNGLIIDLIKS